jgi:hypothetical protein
VREDVESSARRRQERAPALRRMGRARTTSSGARRRGRVAHVHLDEVFERIATKPLPGPETRTETSPLPIGTVTRGDLEAAVEFAQKATSRITLKPNLVRFGARGDDVSVSPPYSYSRNVPSGSARRRSGLMTLY